ncbi:MAG: RloB domain-containing protein [Anaerolineae bacterium]|nr:RloB domain-containing protein [Anaerolineae bacterium]
MAKQHKLARLPDKGRPLKGRVVNTRLVRPRFLIVCEGKQTEPNYFKRFRVNAEVVDVQVVGLGNDPLNLVRQVCELMRQDDYAQVWCVFDRDSFPAEQFNNAIALARQRSIQVAYSNEAFELWYLLHFDYCNTAISRSQYCDMLANRLGFLYRKNDLNMYDRLIERQPTAIQNAQQLLDFYGSAHNPERDNPCTTVHQLVQELNQYIL